MTVRISKRTSSCLKPAVGVVVTSGAYFELEGVTGRNRLAEAFQDAWKILGMRHPTGGPALQLLERSAEVIEAWTVDEFELTGGREGCDQPWNAVHNQPRLALAFAQVAIQAARLRQQLLARLQSLPLELRFAAQPLLALRRVAAQIGHLQVRRDTRQQLPRRKRLHEIVVGAGLQSFDARLLARPRGNQDHRHAAEGRVVANGSQQAESIQLRHHDVRQHQSRTQQARGFQRLAAIRNRVHLISIAEQPP